jgi:hypothetical protein
VGHQYFFSSFMIWKIERIHKIAEKGEKRQERREWTCDLSFPFNLFLSEENFSLVGNIRMLAVILCCMLPATGSVWVKWAVGNDDGA